MTNEEIQKEGLNGVSMDSRYFVEYDFNDSFEANNTEEACDYALDFLMNKARTDERNRIIKEIEGLVNEAKAKDMKEQFGLNTMVVLAVIQAKLNSLKENK